MSRSSNTLDDVYFDFNYFISSALEDALFRVNKLSSLHDSVRAPAGQQALADLENANVLQDVLQHANALQHTNVLQHANILYHLLSPATGEFQIIGNLLIKIGRGWLQNHSST